MPGSLYGHVECDQFSQSLTDKTMFTVKQLAFYVRLAYLFTASDLLPTVVPNVMFGILSAFASSALTINPPLPCYTILCRICLVGPYIWVNVLTFCISNQCCSDSMVEDLRNKPWRPIPAGLITPAAGRQALLICQPVVLTIGWILDVYWETALCMVITQLYNSHKWGDRSPVARNALIAAIFSIIHHAALKITSGPRAKLTTKANLWIAMVGAVVATTMHVSDFHDMEGDREEHRQTVPLIIGENRARWTVAVAVVFWSILVSWFWGLWPVSWLLPCLFSMIIAVREVFLCGKEEDRKTWVYWACWIMSLYASPLRF